jgi:hypothetical protein
MPWYVMVVTVLSLPDTVDYIRILPYFHLPRHALPSFTSASGNEITSGWKKVDWRYGNIRIGQQSTGQLRRFEE